MYRKTINLLVEFSIPLILGVIFALVWANIDPDSYHHFIHYPLLGDNFKILGYTLDLHFLVNDIFMVLFFGIAAVEITQSLSPGGDLNPISKAVNPLMATLGGILGPVAAFFLFCTLFPIDSLVETINSTLAISENISRSDVLNGWGIPTATDIALAWLVARLVFGKSHPAVSFLLLLAVADDAIGLGIIAVFYPDPVHPVEVQYLLLTLLGMALAFGLRKAKVNNMWWYLILGGIPSWLGLIMSHLHPALALVAIVPFMPNSQKFQNDHLFEDDIKHEDSTLVVFEHRFKYIVDFGLFGFGLANAGVGFSIINSLTWIILLSLIVGKTVGIWGFSAIAEKMGSPLPTGMNHKSLFVAGLIAGLGLTVALFVSGEAYTNPTLQGAAKMGALFSAFALVLAMIAGKILKIEKKN